jgi:hypothetical protein
LVLKWWEVSVILILKHDLSGFVQCITPDSAATIDALMRWLSVFGVVLLSISNSGSHTLEQGVKRVQKKLRINLPWRRAHGQNALSSRPASKSSVLSSDRLDDEFLDKEEGD